MKKGSTTQNVWATTCLGCVQLWQDNAENWITPGKYFCENESPKGYACWFSKVATGVTPAEDAFEGFEVLSQVTLDDPTTCNDNTWSAIDTSLFDQSCSYKCQQEGFHNGFFEVQASTEDNPTSAVCVLKGAAATSNTCLCAVKVN